jgi:hypothetical protein
MFPLRYEIKFMCYLDECFELLNIANLEHVLGRSGWSL